MEMTKESDAINSRLDKIESSLLDEREDVAELKGTVKSIQTSLDIMNLTLTKVTTNTSTSGLMQKALLGAIVVQSLLANVTTPDMAKQLITHIFGGG